jgi:hypothetical protein
VTVNEKLKEVLGWPAIIAACLVSIVAVLTFFGFSLKSPAEALTDTMAFHVVEERAYHDAQLSRDQMLTVMMDSLARSMNRLSVHVEHLEVKQDAALRGECLENSREQLVLQGLILECRRLGVDR